ncbi:MAG: hypothetical protein GQE15_13915 [Archangiaceae bacterium]|nr:hypothetical protein [Archangiaceae bacterium]
MRLRWRFPAESEAAARAEVDARIAEWWQAFEAKAEEIEALFAQRVKFDLEAWLSPKLRTIHEQLFWEFSRASGRWAFIVTCEERRELQPLVDRVVSLAPKGLFCDVLNARPAELTTFVLRTVESRFQVDATKWTAAVEPVGHGLLGVTWNGATDDDHEAAVWLTKGLLGEHAMADWVGAVVPGGRSLMSKLFGRSSRVGVSDFVDAFGEAKRRQHDARPDGRLLVSSRVAADANWSVATIDPRTRQGGRQLDLHTTRTADLELLSASIGGVPFSSCRFSRFGETVLYVQTDGFSDEGFTSTLAMEEAVDAALGPLGRTIGAGTGARSSYLNLVVGDVDAALERIRHALQQGKLPTRSWIRFFDDTLANEWVGVWPDSPSPE